MVLTAFRVIIFFVIMPFIPGFVITELAGMQRDYARKGFDFDGLLIAYVLGTLFEWALFEVVAVPMILGYHSLTVLVYSWVILFVLLCGAGMGYLRIRQRRYEKAGFAEGKQSGMRVCRRSKSELFRQFHPAEIIGLLLVIAVIGFQLYNYFFLMHQDGDDSRFVVEAVEAYMHNTMLTADPVTGESLLGVDPGTGKYAWMAYGEFVKDIASPWPIWIAFCGRICGIHPAIMAHTVLPVFLLMTSYGVYWLIGKKLFSNDREKTIWFVFFVAFINMFFAGSTHTQAIVSLVRIWQGKAVVAAIMIPAVFWLFLACYGSEDRRHLSLFFLADLAGCLCSGYGIIIMAVETFILLVYLSIVQKMWKRLWMAVVSVISVIPSIAFAIIYHILNNVLTKYRAEGITQGNQSEDTVWQLIDDGVHKIFGGDGIWILYVLASIFLIFCGRKKRRTVVYPLILLWIVVANPFSYQFVWRRFLHTAWWRLFWLSLVSMVISCAAVELVSRIHLSGSSKAKTVRALAGILAAFCVVLNGSFAYCEKTGSQNESSQAVEASSGGRIAEDRSAVQDEETGVAEKSEKSQYKRRFVNRENWYKIPQVTVAVADALMADTGERPVKVVVDDENDQNKLDDTSMAITLRQYSADINMMYGRNIHNLINNIPPDDERRSVYSILCQDNPGADGLAYVKAVMQKDGYRYLVHKNAPDEDTAFSEAGFVERQTVGEYTIFEIPEKWH